ncbi:MAG: sigma-54-dependent Fis family transcriptional regulator [FCB group bacterium]|nr:sigma-54-dependent Fis family transcriptional regulator [FCB group bacterium]
MKKILIVDDDHSLRAVLIESFKSEGYDVISAKDGATALDILKTEPVNLIVSDLMMPGITGIELMEIVNRDYTGVGFLVITAYGSIELAVEALQKGAFDFVTKPFSLSNITSRVKRYFEFEGIIEENKELKGKLLQETKFKKLVGKSRKMQKVFQQIEIVAKSDAAVFIQGESGTGKELIARAIHELGDRVDKPFLKVNCSAIPESLFESTLFGHEKGSFTNALKMHKGLFEEADTGTLLLDEITEMPLPMQAKLLRVLQEGTLTRVGSTKEIDVNVRVIATSNKSIQSLIDNDRFRQDLYYRLNVFPIKVPPLRSRPEDIPILLNHFIEKFKAKYRYEKKEISAEIVAYLMKQRFEGNVRQLENLLERAILYSGEEESLQMEHFSFESDHPDTSGGLFNNEAMSLAEMEKKMIQSTLDMTDDNRTKAAKILGISVRTLRNKLHQYQMEE